MGLTFAPSATAVLEGPPDDDFALVGAGAVAVAIVAALFAPGRVKRS